MIIQIIFTSFIVPVSQDKARSFLRNSTVNFFGNFIKPQRFNDTIKGVTIYTEKKDAEGNLYNLYLKKEINNSDKDFQITYAKKGIFKEKNNLPILVLYNGQTITNQNGEVTRFGFSKSDFLLKNFKTNTTLYKKTQELSTTNLFRCILFIISSKKEILKKTNYNIENCSIENFVNILKEIYKRIFIPLYIPILMLVPLLLITSSKESENYTRLKFITFGIGLIFIIFSETTIRLISDKQIFNYWIISIPLLFILFLYLTFYKKFNFN